jgi:hypothetical protein
MTDSTTSTGWLKKTIFLERGSDPIKDTIRLEIARKHASHFTHHNIKEYSQWFPGKKNNVADSLSWDFDLDICITHPSFPLTFRLYQYPAKSNFG